MSNFKFYFIGSKTANLEAAIDLASAYQPFVVGWSKDGDWLAFHWAIKDGNFVTPFPDELHATSLKDFIISWLQSNQPAGEPPNIDGSTSNGYEIKTSTSFGDYESFRIRPIWAIYHK